MPSGTYTFTLYNITGTGNGTFTVDSAFTITLFDPDDNLGVGDDSPNTETGDPPVIQSLGAGAPAGWNIGDTFYFGGARGIEAGSAPDDYLLPKVGGAWQTTTALYSMPGASIPFVVGETYTREGLSGNTDGEFVPCFTAGTLIKAISGEVIVENIEIGDLVLTLDSGYQPVRWVGSRTVAVSGNNAPIAFDAGSVGNHTKLLVSPNHRMLIRSPKADLLFGAPEVLVPAKQMTFVPGVRQENPETVTYVHILFDQHEVVYANGAASESFHPGPMAMDALEQASRREVLEIFPELANVTSNVQQTARICVKPHEIQALHAAMF